MEQEDNVSSWLSLNQAEVLSITTTVFIVDGVLPQFTLLSPLNHFFESITELVVD